MEEDKVENIESELAELNKLVTNVYPDDEF